LYVTSVLYDWNFSALLKNVTWSRG